MIYYIGGFGETCNSDASKELKQYGAQCIPIDWDKKVVESVNDIKEIEDNSALIAFSLGGIIALELCNKYQSKINFVMICSLSPYFSRPAEEVPPEVMAVLGQEKIDELLSLDLQKYCEIDIPIVLIQGEFDIQTTKDRINQICDNWKCVDKQIIEIKGVGHNIHDKKYVSSVLDAVKERSMQVSAASAQEIPKS